MPKVDLNRMVFCNTAWMKNYRGRKGDRMQGGGAYVEKHRNGGEQYNFKPVGTRLHGYVSVRGSIHLERLGGEKSAEKIRNVLVVWVAKSPLHGLVITGWYRSAIAYRSFEWDERRRDVYSFDAPVGQAILLPVDERTFSVPRNGPGCMGQSNVWFADRAGLAFKRKALAYVSSHKRPSRGTLRRGRNFGGRSQNYDLRTRTELAAVQEVREYYGKLGYRVRSVERDNVGWDLEAVTKRGAKLRIEVKGLAGVGAGVELTPNEYRAFSERSEEYRLCIVYHALNHPLLSTFAYSKESGRWEDDRGNRLIIKPRVGAQVASAASNHN